jgi:hypothetical protein
MHTKDVLRQLFQGMHSGVSTFAQGRVLYACYKELNQVYRTDVTRRLFLISITILIRDSRPGAREMGRLCIQSIRSMKHPMEFVRLMKSVVVWGVGSGE